MIFLKGVYFLQYYGSMDKHQKQDLDYITEIMHKKAIENTYDMLERFSDIPDIREIWLKVLKELEAKVLL